MVTADRAEICNHASDRDLRNLPGNSVVSGWVALVTSVDFRQGPNGAVQDGVRVEDLCPRKVDGKDLVRIVTERSGDLSFAVEAFGFIAKLSEELSR